MEKKIVSGEVIELLPGSLYKVLTEGREVLCYLSGKMRFNHIKVLLGDKVSLELDPYRGKTSNRIIGRAGL